MYFINDFTPLWDDNLLWQLTKEFQRCMMLAQSSSTQKLKMDCTNSWLKTPHPQCRIMFLSYIPISFYIPVIYSNQNFDWLIWLEPPVKSLKIFCFTKIVMVLKCLNKLSLAGSADSTTTSCLKIPWSMPAIAYYCFIQYAIQWTLELRKISTCKFTYIRHF